MAVPPAVMADIQQSTASSPVGGVPQKCYEGRLGPRIVYLRQDNVPNDTRFFVKVMTISSDLSVLKRWALKLHAWLWYVQIGTDDKNEIYLNVNSLAKRLVLSKRDIYAAAKAGKVRELIYNQVEILRGWLPIQCAAPTMSFMASHALKCALVHAAASYHNQKSAEYKAKSQLIPQHEHHINLSSHRFCFRSEQRFRLSYVANGITLTHVAKPA